MTSQWAGWTKLIIKSNKEANVKVEDWLAERNVDYKFVQIRRFTWLVFIRDPAVSTLALLKFSNMKCVKQYAE